MYMRNCSNNKKINVSNYMICEKTLYVFAHPKLNSQVLTVNKFYKYCLPSKVVEFIPSTFTIHGWLPWNAHYTKLHSKLSSSFKCWFFIMSLYFLCCIKSMMPLLYYRQNWILLNKEQSFKNKFSGHKLYNLDGMLFALRYNFRKINIYLVLL